MVFKGELQFLLSKQDHCQNMRHTIKKATLSIYEGNDSKLKLLSFFILLWGFYIVLKLFLMGLLGLFPKLITYSSGA